MAYRDTPITRPVGNIRWKKVQADANRAQCFDAAKAFASFSHKYCANEIMQSWDKFDLQNPDTWVMLPPNCLQKYGHAD